jgi:hypothetical protein
MQETPFINIWSDLVKPFLKRLGHRWTARVTDLGYNNV